MRELADQLLQTIRKRELFRAGDRVAAAVSGGADSVALALLLIELQSEIGIALSVAHVNHKLRGEESEVDEQFVRDLAAQYKLEFLTRTASVAGKRHSGIEAEARRQRYEFFRDLGATGKATKVVTAHTLDDQAETVLLRMFRGTGIRGLAGIHPKLELEQGGRPCGEVVRPLLGFRRIELREYLSARGQSWREDSSNQDEAFLRNRLRRRLLPIIAEEFGDATIEHLAELSEIARAEEEWWEGPERSTSNQYPVLRTNSVVPMDSRPGRFHTGERAPAGTGLDVDRLLALPLAVRRRLVRAWIEVNAPDARISFRLIEGVLEFAREKGSGVIDLPVQVGNTNEDYEADQSLRRWKNAHWRIRREAGELIIEPNHTDPHDYQCLLPVPGEVTIPGLQLRITAQLVDVGEISEPERDGLLDPTRLRGDIFIRNWRPGDRYWPAHTKHEKKIKELLNERHITAQEKKLWPVAESRGEIVWVRGFAAPEALRARAKAVWIRDAPSVS